MVAWTTIKEGNSGDNDAKLPERTGTRGGGEGREDGDIFFSMVSINAIFNNLVFVFKSVSKTTRSLDEGTNEEDRVSNWQWIAVSMIVAEPARWSRQMVHG